jgi:hypothetical protein
MAGAPGAEDTHGINEFFAGAGERISDLRRRGVGNFAMDNAVVFELAELRGEDFFAHAGKKIAKFCEAFRAEAQIPDGEDLPLAADGIDGSLHRAAVMIFQGASRLTRTCVLPAGSRWLYHCGEVKKIGPARLGSSDLPRFVTCLSWEKRK